ncbi:UNVERIFIED_CONTAM: Transcription factor NAI1 [Sesamum calycinum]|uniref:Transcription factor NAI1 n=1 Tax=Sesamum calycinum TaxID=2727403 RepID=A0AAW2MPK3_9LAMI
MDFAGDLGEAVEGKAFMRTIYVHGNSVIYSTQPSSAPIVLSFGNVNPSENLQQTDKTSVLGDAIKYLKHLQKRVETLEEKAAKRTMEPVVHVKKSQILVEDEGSSDEKSGSSREQVQEPEIEARVVNNQILLRVHCGKQKGTLANLLSKVESLNLVVVNTSVTPFGSSAQDITIIAEMEKEFNMTVKEVASVLRASLQ